MLSLIPRLAPWPYLRPGISNAALAQFRFINGEAINEVTERFATITAGVTTANDRMNTGTSFAHRLDSDSIVFAANEDFCIEGRVFITTLGPDGALLAGVWTSGGQLGNAWSLHVRQPDGRVGFYFSVDGSNYLSVISNDIVYANTEYHIAAWRKAGVIRLAINGKIQTATLEEPRACYRPARRLSTSWIGANGYMAGWRDSLRICREAVYGTEDFTPPIELPDVQRDLYSPEDAAACVFQLGLRSDCLLDEVTENQLTMTAGVSMVDGRITQAANTTSFYTIPSKPFGAGDFCIELSTNITNVSPAWGTILMGNWRATSVASDENRWGVYVDPSRRLGFIASRTANANDSEFMMSAATLPAGVDLHICIERYLGVVTIYVNGIPVGSSSAFDFPLRGDPGSKVHSNSSQNAYTSAMSIWNMRIMDKAMYKGAFSPPVVFPSLPAIEHKILENGALAPGFSLMGNSSIDLDGVSLSNGGYIESADAPAFSFWRGDFTYECVVTPRSAILGTGSGSGNALTTLWAWHSWGAGGRPLNWEFIINHTTGTIGLNTSYSDTSQNRGFTKPLTMGVKYKIKLVRKRGMLYLYVDDTLIGSSQFLINVAHDAVLPITIGRRRGGGSGEVDWFCDALFERITFVREARV